MKSISWHGLGLRGRLFAAFGAVAAITVLASATAFVSYDRLGRSLEVVTGTSLPHVTGASNVAVAAAEVVGQAQALLAASGAGERTRALKTLDAARAALNDAVATLPGEEAAKLKETAGHMSENLDRLAQSVAEGQAIAAERATLVGAARAAHEKLAGKLVPMVDDAAFALTLAIEQAADTSPTSDARWGRSPTTISSRWRQRWSCAPKRISSSESSSRQPICATRSRCRPSRTAS